MIKRFSHIALLIILAVPLLLTSCFWTSVPGLPVINSFNATPAAVADGSPAVLDWNVSNATALIIDQGVGSVSSAGTSVVMPAATTTYTITAVNAAGAVTKSVTVAVNSASVTTTPVPAAIPPAGPLPQGPPGDRDYIGSTYNHIYHHTWCTIGKNISPPHKVHFETWQAAKTAGYQPCGTCRPPF